MPETRAQGPARAVQGLLVGATRSVTLRDGARARLHVWGTGAGKRRLVVVHGWLHSGARWGPLMLALAASGWRCAAPDLPGFGRSPPLAGKPSLDRLAAALGAWLAAEPLPDAILADSMGSLLLLSALRHHEGRVPRLILQGVPADGVPLLAPIARRRGFMRALLATGRALPAWLVGPPIRVAASATIRLAATDRLLVGDVRRGDPATAAAILDEMTNGRIDNVPEAARRAKCLVVRGEKDPISTSAAASRVAHLLAAPVATITKAGHTPQTENLEGLLAVVRRFLR